MPDSIVVTAAAHQLEANLQARIEKALVEPHDCGEHAVYITTDGPIGHGWECGVCGTFLQAG